MHRIAYALLAMLLVSCQTGREHSPGDDYAVWSAANTDGTWTRSAETAVRNTSLPRQVPKDIAAFCPRYPSLDSESRVMFWAGLLSAMAKFESNFNPETKFTEELRDSHKNRVVSRGLLQISIESANQARYACGIVAAKDLHDPAINLSCAARILSTWVELDDVVAATGRENTGGARYWSVLRHSNGRAARVRALTKELSFCEARSAT